MKAGIQDMVSRQATSPVRRLISLFRAVILGADGRPSKRFEEAIETAIGVLAVFAWLAAMTLL